MELAVAGTRLPVATFRTCNPTGLSRAGGAFSCEQVCGQVGHADPSARSEVGCPRPDPPRFGQHRAEAARKKAARTADPEEQRLAKLHHTEREE
jgi:hypothetical protein